MSKKRLGLVLGIIILTVFLIMPPASGLSTEGWYTAGIALLMAAWWITEAVPIPVTALLPIILFPVLGVDTTGSVTAPYANPIIFLFMGGFVLAIAMQRWDLHKRLALNVLNTVGTKPKSIILGFIIASAVISMWVSNTATALMMLPIGLSVIQLLEKSERRDGSKNFQLVLVLSIAFACSVGGIGTLIGSPPNALLAGFMLDNYGIEISFLDWMKVGVPIVLIALPIIFYVLLLVYPVKLKKIPGGEKLIHAELRSLGKMGSEEKRVAAVFVLAAVLWIFNPLINKILPFLSDSSVAVLVAFLLFILPRGKNKMGRILHWEDTKDLPWGILLLFGGGLSLAHSITKTGLAEWIGGEIANLDFLPIFLILAISLLAILTVTELMSNTAATATFLPIMASVAIGLKQDPLFFALPIAIAASCAFMMPVSTPPNAVVYSSGKVTIVQMVKAGLWLDLVFAVLLFFAAMIWFPIFF